MDYMSLAKVPSVISKEIFTVAGIQTTVYGLQELNPDLRNVACLWLLHPRLATHAYMEPLATMIIHDQQRVSRGDEKPSIGLIAVSFDQRNHGSREVNKLANEEWISGNKTHAQDMFSIFHGTSIDVSLLITHISTYVFPMSNHTITMNMVCGISLGGHGGWSCIVNDPRITTAIIIVGCPDYANLMCHRAQTSNLDSWTGSSPPGSRFLGSEDFPNNLVKAVNTYDPAGMFRGSSLDREDPRFSDEPSKAEKMRLIPIFRKSLQKKRILNLAGGSDTLVPYQCAKPFLQWLKNATSKDGWFREGQVLIKDIVYEGVGHVMTLEMAKEAVRFVAESLRNPPATSKLSKL